MTLVSCMYVGTNSSLLHFIGFSPCEVAFRQGPAREALFVLCVLCTISRSVSNGPTKGFGPGYSM